MLKYSPLDLRKANEKIHEVMIYLDFSKSEFIVEKPTEEEKDVVFNDYQLLVHFLGQSIYEPDINSFYKNMDLDNIKRILSSGEHFSYNYRMRTENRFLWFEILIFPLFDELKSDHAVAIILPIKNRKTKEISFLYEANSVGGVFKRTVFDTIMRHTIELEDGNTPYLYFIINVLNLDDILEEHESTFLIPLLDEITLRAMKLAKTSIFCNATNDKIFVFKQLKANEDAKQVLSDIYNSFNCEIAIGDIKTVVSAAVGGTLFPFDGTELNVLYIKANYALHFATQNGSFALYDKRYVQSITNEELLSIQNFHDGGQFGAVKSTLVDKIYRLIFGENDGLTVIDRIISYIGKYFSAKDVYVLNANKDGVGFTVSNWWNANNSNFLNKLNQCFIETTRENLASQESHVLSPNKADVGLRKAMNLLKNESADVFGFISSFAESYLILGYSNVREIAVYDQKSLQYVAKIIGTEIENEYQAELLASNINIVKGLISGDHFCYYKINSKNYQVIDYNEPAKQKYTNIALGQPCYNVIYGKTAPCEKCIFAHQQKNIAHSVELINDKFHQKTCIRTEGKIGNDDAWTIILSERPDLLGISNDIDRLLRQDYLCISSFNTKKMVVRQIELNQGYIDSYSDVTYDEFISTMLLKRIKDEAFRRGLEQRLSFENLGKEKAGQLGLFLYEVYYGEDEQLESISVNRIDDETYLFYFLKVSPIMLDTLKKNVSVRSFDDIMTTVFDDHLLIDFENDRYDYIVKHEIGTVFLPKEGSIKELIAYYYKVMHQDDWAPFRRLYEIGKTEDVLSYLDARRCDNNGNYNWWNFLFKRDSSSPYLMIYAKINLSAAVNIEDRGQNDEWTKNVYASYDQIFRWDLLTDTKELIYDSEKTIYSTTTIIDGQKVYDDLQMVEEKNRLEYQRYMSIGEVREHFASKSGGRSLIYSHLCRDGSYHRVLSRIMKSTNEDNIVYIFDVDIEGYLRLEAEAEQRISKYAEVFIKTSSILLIVKRSNLKCRFEKTVINPIEWVKETTNYFDFYEQLSTVVHSDDLWLIEKFLSIEMIQTPQNIESDPVSIDFRMLEEDGNYVWHSMIIYGDESRAILLDRRVNDTKQLSIAKIESDYGEQIRETENQLLETENIYDVLLHQTNTIVFTVNQNTGQIHFTSLLKQKFGINYRKYSSLSEIAQIIVSHEDYDVFMKFCNREIDDFDIEIRFIDQDKKIIWCRVSILSVENINETINMSGVIQDINDTKKAYETLRYEAYNDGLTGLLNDRGFVLETENRINEGHPQLLIGSLDISKFKLINEIYGVELGDKVLIHIANVLRDVLPEDAIIARIHSDLFNFTSSYTSIVSFEKKMNEVFNRIRTFDEKVEAISSIGIYIVDNSNIAIPAMCDRARLAQKKAKGNIVKFMAIYSDNYRDEILEDLFIEKEMGLALEREDFQLYLQPKISLANEEIIGAEALVRWIHPIKGIIFPDKFIPLFERNGFIINLDNYMWDKACQTIRKWENQGRTVVPISTNVSRLDIYSMDIVSRFIELTEKHQISRELIKLEITETLFQENGEVIIDVLNRLHDAGFKIELDDFGSGYSSLNMLRNFPFDTLKLDRLFLDDTLSSERGKMIIRYVISMSKSLDLNVIAEGVETKEQVEFLRNALCDDAQGYYFARPMEISAFEKLLDENKLKKKK